MGVSGSEVTDLGVRYLAGLAPTAQQTEEGGEQGCKRLHTLGTTLTPLLASITSCWE